MSHAKYFHVFKTSSQSLAVANPDHQDHLWRPIMEISTKRIFSMPKSSLVNTYSGKLNGTGSPSCPASNLSHCPTFTPFDALIEKASFTISIAYGYNTRLAVSSPCPKSVVLLPLLSLIRYTPVILPPIHLKASPASLPLQFSFQPPVIPIRLVESLPCSAPIQQPRLPFGL